MAELTPVSVLNTLDCAVPFRISVDVRRHRTLQSDSTPHPQPRPRTALGGCTGHSQRRSFVFPFSEVRQNVPPTIRSGCRSAMKGSYFTTIGSQGLRSGKAGDAHRAMVRKVVQNRSRARRVNQSFIQITRPPPAVASFRPTVNVEARRFAGAGQGGLYPRRKLVQRHDLLLLRSRGGGSITTVVPTAGLSKRRPSVGTKENAPTVARVKRRLANRSVLM